MATTSSSLLTSEDTEAEIQPNCNSTPGNCSLEELPAEIRHHILYVLDFEELGILIHASPLFHQQYRAHHSLFLWESLKTTMGNIIVDACAVYQSARADCRQLCNQNEVTHFLASYQNRRSSIQRPDLTTMLTENEIVGIAAFHSSVIKPLVRTYTGWALANLTEETGDQVGISQSEKILSRTEEIRLFRAFYRFQLCCNLFGNGRRKFAPRCYPRFDSLDILTIFFCLFEPWEVEEIVCVYTFAKEKYDQIFHEIQHDVDERNPRFKDQCRPYSPEGAFDLEDFSSRLSLLTGTICCGLDLLHTVCYEIKDHEHLVSMMQANITHPAGYFLEDGALGDLAQYRRCEERPSARDVKQWRGDPMPFRGDGDPDELGPRPALAWTLIWGEKYSNLYGYYVPDTIHQWGYVLWDAARLERTGAKDVLFRQWSKSRDTNDPNDLALRCYAE